MLKSLHMCENSCIFVLTNKQKTNKMEYTEKQIRNAKLNYNNFLKFHTINDYDVNVIGINETERRIEFHNNIVNEIRNGNKEVEREWKYFFLKEEVKKDQKNEERKMKKNKNKELSADILRPIKEIKKLGAFGKWLNTPGNKFRKQHFNKLYTENAVNEFLLTL